VEKPLAAIVNDSRMSSTTIEQFRAN